jgi:hypothetical protein
MNLLRSLQYNFNLPNVEFIPAETSVGLLKRENKNSIILSLSCLEETLEMQHWDDSQLQCSIHLSL